MVKISSKTRWVMFPMEHLVDEMRRIFHALVLGSFEGPTQINQLLWLILMQYIIYGDYFGVSPWIVLIVVQLVQDVDVPSLHVFARQTSGKMLHKSCFLCNILIFRPFYSVFVEKQWFKFEWIWTIITKFKIKTKMTSFYQLYVKMVCLWVANENNWDNSDCWPITLNA